ncbi:N-acetyl-beta-glucosaminyl-glycoprotein 4-beta-N-acetylgalactosaminyltransferase 1-like [Dendronephthya gigantea]|uniref:N-acetyl-beta-glucosaminyl-glycoprotein 4-beta-N-acetylgalactosaminyltransferase 1-like n=1 Tax=Dendronephthya gigantea TaxID=151771 RepID=UPI00106BACB4|nr:N-acetyl-beta-glucosaminyl-glycoprotein 4-beta-N-acetylgalactosaminyltransferase 1-like [Dendronephthya gigantea]
MNVFERSPGRVLPPEKSTLVGFIPRRHVTESIHVCSLHETQVWKDNPGKMDITVYTDSDPIDGFVNETLKLIMALFQKAVPSKYPAYKINKLELTRNSTDGDLSRVMIDLNLTVDGLDYIERFSEYIFAYHQNSRLEICRPLFFQWKRPVTLTYAFLTDCSRNDQPWGLYFIENTIELLQRSLEVNMMVVITACNEEQRRNYESRLRYSDIDRNAVVLLEKAYMKSQSLKYVLSLVENDTIVVVCDSTVRMPAGFSEEIRKHTFRTLMAYSPVPFQLECGHFPESTPLNGHWCPECAGVTAMYKEDWEQILPGSYDNENEDIMEDKEKLLSHIKKTEMEIAQVKLKHLYRL